MKINQNKKILVGILALASLTALEVGLVSHYKKSQNLIQILRTETANEAHQLRSKTIIKADQNKDGRVNNQEWTAVFRYLGKALDYERTAKYSSYPTEYLTNEDMKNYLGEK